MRGELTMYERWKMLDQAQMLIDDNETDVTYEQLEAMSDEDLITWVESWNEEEKETRP